MAAYLALCPVTVTRFIQRFGVRRVHHGNDEILETNNTSINGAIIMLE